MAREFTCVAYGENRRRWSDTGDQVLALFRSERPPGRDGRRHVGIVVASREQVAKLLGVENGGRLDFHDPWGNHVQVVDYGECRFRKAEPVEVALGLDDLEKSPEAKRELREAGLAG